MNHCNCFDSKGRKITKIGIPHKDTYNLGKAKINEKFIVVQFKEGIAAILK